MSNQLSVKNNFTSGLLSENLFGRGDLRIYENGARNLQNVVIQPTGGVSRRAGLRYIDDVPSYARLISFEFNTEQTYLLCLMNKSTRVYKDGVCIATLETPWQEEDLKKINWTQSADTLLLVHPNYFPQMISRTSNEVWQSGDWTFFSKDNQLFMPFFNFYKNAVGMSSSGTSGAVTLTTASAVFDEKYIGVRIRLNGGEATITAVTDSTHATATMNKNFSSGNLSLEWEEQAFSTKRGYPISVTFHQDRMVVGGSKSLPNHLWLSKSSDLFNFDIGTGLDDESIDFSILSDQVNAITNVVSTRHLLVFTTGAEWMVSGEPLTPTSIKLNRQTNVGSYNKYSLLPQNIDGATTFISQNGRQLREFLYTDVEQAYQAKDLTLLSSEIIDNPCDISYFQSSSILYVVLEDGTISCLTSYRTEEVNAWSRMKTDGRFITIAVIGDEVYLLVKRGEKYTLEIMDERFFVDNGKSFHSDTPQKLWNGLEYLNGKKVMVVADNYNIGDFIVQEGQIELKDEAGDITIGLPYEHIIEPLPLMCDGARPYPAKAYRLIQGVFRIVASKSLKLDLGNGYMEVPLKKIGRDQILDSPPVFFSGDVELRSIGWIRNLNKSAWSIKSDEPCAFTLLSTLSEIKTKG